MTKSFSDMKEKKTPCWSGYKMVGMKKKNGRMVPNCVKEEYVDLVLGKEYVSEGVEDMYKSKLNQAQINTIKNTWQNKKTLMPQDKERVKKFLDSMDQFTKMELKKANIKHVSAMIEDKELDFSEALSDIVEDIEFKAAVRGQELKEFTDDQLNKLAIAYKDLAGKTMSVQNANKLRKLFDRIPDSSLDKIRRKKIPFISGLALSRMIQKKMPVRESSWEEYAEFEGVEQIQEADLTKSQIKKVHKQADDLPKKDFIKRYGKDGDSVRYATATNMVKKKMGIGESKFKLNKGELTMSESYKERFDSAMGHLGISSLGELNPEDQKPFFAFVDDLKEGLSAAQKKLPPALQKAIAKKMSDKKENLVGGQKKLDKDKDGDLDSKDFAMLRKMKKEEKTKETDSEPKMKDLNAMVKDPHKSKEDKPMKDMNAMYMKSNVKAPVKDNGGADMAKVKDKPAMKEPMKKINAMYKESNRPHRYLKTKPGSLEEAVLISRGLVKKSLIERTEYTISMRDASFFKGNDIRKAMMQTKKDGNTDKALDNLDMVGGDDEEGITFTANNSSEAIRNAEKAILDYRNKEVNRDRNALFVFNDLELQLVKKPGGKDPDGELPTSQEKNMFRSVFRKYNGQPMFNTPNGRGPSDLDRFVKDNGLDDMVRDGVM